MTVAEPAGLSPSSPIVSSLRRLVASEGAQSTEPVPLSPEGWNELVSIAGPERLGGLIRSAVARGVSIPPDSVQQRIDALTRTDMASELKRTMVLHQVVDHLDDLGTDYRLMKGVAAAHTLYADPSHRTTGDIDLLLPASDIHAAAWSLLESGFAIAHPFRGRNHASITRSLTVRHEAGVEIDLHRRFGDASYWERAGAGTPFGSPPLEFVLDGRPMKALGYSDQLVASLAHLTRPHHLVTFVDVAVLVSRLDAGGEDWTAFARKLPAGVLHRIAPVCDGWVDLPTEALVANGHGRRLERWLVGATFGRPDIEAIEQVRLAPSVMAGARYLVECVRPSEEWRTFSQVVTERESSGSLHRLVSRSPFRRGVGGHR